MGRYPSKIHGHFKVTDTLVCRNKEKRTKKCSWWIFSSSARSVCTKSMRVCCPRCAPEWKHCEQSRQHLLFYKHTHTEAHCSHLHISNAGCSNINAAAAVALVVDILFQLFIFCAVASTHRRFVRLCFSLSRVVSVCWSMRSCVIGGRVLVNYASEKFTKRTHSQKILRSQSCGRMF